MEMLFFFKKYTSIFMLLISFPVAGTLCGKAIVPELSSHPQQIGKFSLRDASRGWGRAALQRTWQEGP